MKQLCIGLLLACIAGSVLAQTEARIQIIHNSADPVLEKVDIYVNDQKVVNNIQFRQATEFISVSLEELSENGSDRLELSVTKFDAIGTEDALYSVFFRPSAGSDYVAMLTGLQSPEAFSANPEGHATDLDFIVMRARTRSASTNKVDLAFIHGVTDARSCGLYADGTTPLASLTPYQEALRYTPVHAGTSYMELMEGRNSQFWQSDLAARAGEAGVLFSSGFSSFATNRQVSTMGLYIAYPDGIVSRLMDEDPSGQSGDHN